MMRLYFLYLLLLMQFSAFSQRPNPYKLPVKEKKISPYRGTDSSTQVVLIRPYNYMNALANCFVYLNGEEIVVLKNNSYHFFPIKPGRHEFSWEGKKKRSLALDISSGDKIYILYERTFLVKPGLNTATADFMPVLTDSIEGKNALKSKRRIE